MFGEFFYEYFCEIYEKNLQETHLMLTFMDNF